MTTQKIDASPEGYSENINLFNVLPTETSVENINFQVLNPTSQLLPDANINFYYSGTTNLYTDLKRSSIAVKAKILDENDQAVGDQPVALANLGLHSCFKQCDIALNQKVISANVSTNFAYKSMIDTLLSHSEGPKTTILQNSLFFKDTASTKTEEICSPDYNTGFLDRQRYIRKTVELFQWMDL